MLLLHHSRPPDLALLLLLLCVCLQVMIYTFHGRWKGQVGTWRLQLLGYAPVQLLLTPHGVVYLYRGLPQRPGQLLLPASLCANVSRGCISRCILRRRAYLGAGDIDSSLLTLDPSTATRPNQQQIDLAQEVSLCPLYQLPAGLNLEAAQWLPYDQPPAQPGQLQLPLAFRFGRKRQVYRCFDPQYDLLAEQRACMHNCTVLRVTGVCCFRVERVPLPRVQLTLSQSPAVRFMWDTVASTRQRQVQAPQAAAAAATAAALGAWPCTSANVLPELLSAAMISQREAAAVGLSCSICGREAAACSDTSESSDDSPRSSHQQQQHAGSSSSSGRPQPVAMQQQAAASSSRAAAAAPTMGQRYDDDVLFWLHATSASEYPDPLTLLFGGYAVYGQPLM